MTFFPILPRFHAPFLFFEDFSTNPGGTASGHGDKNRQKPHGRSYTSDVTYAASACLIIQLSGGGATGGRGECLVPYLPRYFITASRILAAVKPNFSSSTL